MAIGDNGLILLRAEDVGHGPPPAAGHVDLGVAGRGPHDQQPGPLWFDVLAPFVKVAGPSVGLAVAVDGGQPGRHRAERRGRRNGSAGSGPWS